ncbi:MAG: serine protein kinase PrkA [Thermodesulfobacteriota bacterium]
MEENVNKALQVINLSLKERNMRYPVSFADFMALAVDKPALVLRNIFQVFHDMVKSYVGDGINEYPDDPESVGFDYYDCHKLFVEGADHPFFADRIFANRFINHIEVMKSGVQQNKIYIFDGPPGCGKSTFLNNLLMKFEEYVNTEAGIRFEVVWRLNPEALGVGSMSDTGRLVDRLAYLLGYSDRAKELVAEAHDFAGAGQKPEGFTSEWSFPHAVHEYVEMACPSHDHPILLTPKASRRAFLEELMENHPFKQKLFTEKEYEWIFRDSPCNICGAMYEALLEKLEHPAKVFEMIYARPYKFNRRQGEGITVFNPGDKPLKQNTLSNPMIQNRINEIFRDSNKVLYIFSQYAKTNNGIYALMDIKSHNTERLIELHNIISEGVHKVEYFEENVNSLFLAVMNPEDKANIKDFPSFSDRIQYINLPYVLDVKTEVEIYRHIFGKNIDDKFLPRVLHNFARVVISTRLEEKSEALLDWIKQPEKYHLYCDDNLQLLKMDLYTGYIPLWLSEEDRKEFSARRRRKILQESNKEGRKGLSGRDSIKIFGEFYSKFAREESLINMSMICGYFTKTNKEVIKMIPANFLDSLLRMYNYLILQEVKESLYYYNEEQISRDIQNYVFALNFEPGTVQKCSFTGEKLEITEAFLQAIEARLLSASVDRPKRLSFRKEVQKEYTSSTLTQEILLEGRPMVETKLYQSLHERYVHNLKQKALDPFLENENFRRAIMDYGTESFKTYDTRIKDEVTFLLNNLSRRYRYSPQGAQSVCVYVIDNDLARKFKNA